MTTDRQQIEVGGIAVEVIRKENKHLHVGVYPPHGHTARFRELMDGLMPSWQVYRDELNRAPLAHEDWPY